MPERAAVRRLQRLVFALLGFALVLQFTLFGYAIYESQQSQGKIDAVNRFIFCTLERSEKTLPTIEYYQSHPDELERQLMLIAEQKDEFSPPPEPCEP